MSTPADIDTRTQRALLANLRQRLLTPADALVGYGELLYEQARDAGFREMLPDLEKILAAARTLRSMVDALLDDGVAQSMFDGGDLPAAERQLRHDLRTPINGVKGYAEMLLEDLEDLAAGDLRDDLMKLLDEADRLLSELDAIVRLSRGTADIADEDEAVMSRLMRSIERAEASTLKKQTGYILVVDDIEANRDLMSRRLAKDGHRVATANDGKQALLRLEGEEFDLVLLDLMMPGMNGYEVLKRMKSDDRMRNVPVIMVSALNETDSVVRCLEAGAHDYLLKPFDPVILNARIASGLESKQWSDDERRQRQYIKQAFSRFISPAVVDRLVSDPSRLALGGERVDITCVFTDLAGFTGLIESSEPTTVLPVLNRYLDGLCKVFLEHDGTIDKIVGDALHGFFGAPLAQPDHAERAMRCALDLDRYAKGFAEEEDASMLGFGATRIGVHSGVAVVGNFGGDAFFDYTAHGDVINTAARMESANKYLGTTLCVSADTAARCRGTPFRPIGHLLLKGKTESVEAYEPLDAARAESVQVAEYIEAYKRLDAGSEGVGELFARLVEEYPDDPLIALHARRLAAGETGTLIAMEGK